MTLPYIWYRASVWILLCEAVNNFWGFLVIFWKVPVIMELAACSAKLEPPLWRPLSSFPLATWRWIIFEHVFFFFFSLMVDYIWVTATRSLMIFLCVWLFFIPFYFHPVSATPQSPAHTSETSAERLALACERVHADNAMHYVFTAFVWNAAAVILASL